MTRYTRGKSTHQRVEADSTSWQDLQATPAKKNNKTKYMGGQKNRNNNGGGGGGGSRGGGNRKFLFSKDRSQSQRGSGGGNKSFGRGGGGRREEEVSANFAPLGDRPSKTGGDNSNNKNVKGFGKSKVVKIFGQFWVQPEDAERLQDLAAKLKQQGMSRKDILTALQNERRKAEKAGKRARDKVCFQCRQFGHILSDCPSVKKSAGDDGGAEENLVEGPGEICFKCGSTEHTSRRCKKSGEKFDFATCFICSKSGHIARQCPENTKGIYPQGGCCGSCGEVTHLRQNCPMNTGETEATDPYASRMTTPFTSTEYEPDIPQPKPVKESDSDPIADEKPKAKKRRIKF